MRRFVLRLGGLAAVAALVIGVALIGSRTTAEDLAEQAAAAQANGWAQQPAWASAEESKATPQAGGGTEFRPR